MQKIYLTDDDAQLIIAPDDRATIARFWMDGVGNLGCDADPAALDDVYDLDDDLSPPGNGRRSITWPARAYLEAVPGLIDSRFVAMAAKYPPPPIKLYDLADDAAPASRPPRFDADYGA